MAKLPKAIIKKYGISKKAWTVFRGRRGGTMVKRKGRKGFFRKSKSSPGGLIQIDAMAYGALRPVISNLIAPVANMIPLGNLADEVGMGILDYYLARQGGMIGNIARKGLVIENAMIGGSLGSGLLGGSRTISAETMFG